MPEREGGRRAGWTAAGALVALLAAGAGAAAAGPEPDEPGRFSVSSPIGDLEWRPGRGLSVGRTGLTIGGYASLVAERDEGEHGELAIDDLSVFLVFDPHPRLHLFTELEWESLARIDDRGRASAEGARFEIERAYGDVLLAPGLALRAGKFLTPVGRWNEFHAQPLVWTTSRPLATEIPFDESTTGLALAATRYGTRSTTTLRLFGQATDPLEPTPQPVEQRRAGGARAELAIDDGPELGATALSFRARDGGRWVHLAGTDLLWRIQALEIHAEAVASDGDGVRGEAGGFAQLAYEVRPRWFGIGRYEVFAPRSGGSAVHLFDLGVAHRPWPSLVLKAELLFANRASDVADPGFKASVAWLF